MTIRKVGDASQKVSDSVLHFYFWLCKEIELSFQVIFRLQLLRMIKKIRLLHAHLGLLHIVAVLEFGL